MRSSLTLLFLFISDIDTAFVLPDYDGINLGRKRFAGRTLFTRMRMVVIGRQMRGRPDVFRNHCRLTDEYFWRTPDER